MRRVPAEVYLKYGGHLDFVEALRKDLDRGDPATNLDRQVQRAYPVIRLWDWARANGGK